MRKRLFLLNDIDDKENFVFIVSGNDDKVDEIMARYRTGGFSRQELCDMLTEADVQYDLIFPEDYEILTDNPSSFN